MSKIADEIEGSLRRSFPLNVIEREYYIYYEKTRLFFDFFIRNLNVLIEVQGRQHVKFVKHFHGDRESFLDQKRRDNLKLQYVQERDVFTLVRFYYDEIITDDVVKNKIGIALKSEEGFHE